MAGNRLTDDMKKLHLLPQRKASKISAKNAIFKKSHKEHCNTLDAERKTRLSSFRRTKREMEQRLTRHAQDSLSFDDIKNLYKYVDDGKDKEQFRKNFRAARRRSGSTASLSSTLSSNSFSIASSARVNSVPDKDISENKCDENNNSEGIKEVYKNVMDCNVPQGYSKGEIGNCPINKISANVQDLVKGNNKLPIKKLTPIPQENDDQEGDELPDVNKNLNTTNSQTKQRIESWMMDVSKERALSGRPDYGSRRSISWGEGSRLRETILTDVIHKSQSSQELPRFQQRRRSVDVVGLRNSLEKLVPGKRVRRKSLDFSSQEKNALEVLKRFNSKSNSSAEGSKTNINVESNAGDNSEDLLSGSEIPRHASVKVYSEQPFYVRRKKQLTRRMSWQATVMPEDTSKSLQKIQGEKPEEKDKETPLCDLLPPILLPSIYSQQSIHDNEKESLKQRAKHRLEKSVHPQATDRIYDCRYLRMPIRR